LHNASLAQINAILSAYYSTVFSTTIYLDIMPISVRDACNRHRSEFATSEVLDPTAATIMGWDCFAFLPELFRLHPK
jgi:hypothetical protein